MNILEIIKFFIYNDKIIDMSLDGWSSMMGDAIPGRIFFEFLRPTSAIKLSKEICTQEEKVNKSEPHGPF